LVTLMSCGCRDIGPALRTLHSLTTIHGLGFQRLTTVWTLKFHQCFLPDETQPTAGADSQSQTMMVNLSAKFLFNKTKVDGTKRTVL